MLLSTGCVTTIKNVIVNRLCHHYQKRYCQQAVSSLSKTLLSTGCVTTIKNVIVNRPSHRQHAMSPTKYYATVNILRHRQQVASTCYVNKRHSQSINQCLCCDASDRRTVNEPAHWFAGLTSASLTAAPPPPPHHHHHLPDPPVSVHPHLKRFLVPAGVRCPCFMQ